MVSKAKESRLVATARKKLEKQLALEKQHFTPASFKRAEEIIRQSIRRHKHKNESLKTRNVSILTTPKSKEIQHLLKVLQG